MFRAAIVDTRLVTDISAWISKIRIQKRNDETQAFSLIKRIKTAEPEQLTGVGEGVWEMVTIVFRSTHGELGEDMSFPYVSQPARRDRDISRPSGIHTSQLALELGLLVTKL